MSNPNRFEFDDLQGLFRFGYGKLTEACFMLLRIKQAATAKAWLAQLEVNTATRTATAPESAVQVAFSASGLRLLGLKEQVIRGFSDEFIVGMAGDESRSRRLGDSGNSAPEFWLWGNPNGEEAHLLLMLYAREGGLQTLRDKLESDSFRQGLQLQQLLPTHDLGGLEPFGFPDGISQPEIDWENLQSTDLHERDRYSNRLAAGELVLGYSNEYGLYTDRPLIDPDQDPAAAHLPDAADRPGMKDLGRNGGYLVLRQLAQDVRGFWQFLDRAANANAQERERLAAAMVGRDREGKPLVELTTWDIPGIDRSNLRNRFTYEEDPAGNRCPIGAHIRRSNPRTGDFPPGVTGLFTRLWKTLGFGQSRADEDLIASTRFHRLLRRGRAYGPALTPEQALQEQAALEERGLHFICLVANISRQFEFVQNAWNMSSKFAGLMGESDPLLGRRAPLLSGESTDSFHRPDNGGPTRKTCRLPEFVTVRGGGYFFMPGVRALKYIASVPVDKGGKA